jgi:AcrR family transcriptional regulator
MAEVQPLPDPLPEPDVPASRRTDTGVPGHHRRVRKSPTARRAEIVDAARTVFAESGYEDAGLADISDVAQVSKGLLYHYFPEGRPALFAAVTEQLLTELGVRLEHATRVPFSARRRLDHLLATLFGFFTERPDAYRHLFEDGRASRDPLVSGSTAAARLRITTELAAVMASVRLSPDELLAASHGILGFALATLDLCLAGRLDAELAWRITCDYAATLLDEE